MMFAWWTNKIAQINELPINQNMGIILFSAEGYIWGMNEKCFNRFERETAIRMIASDRSTTKEK